MKFLDTIALLTLILIVLSALWIFVVSSMPRSRPCGEQTCIQMAKSRIPIGEDRAQAIQALSDAWYHGECLVSDEYRVDTFLYGTRERRGVEVVEVMSKLVEGTFIVNQVAAFDNYIYFDSGYGRNNYSKCLPEYLYR